MKALVLCGGRGTRLDADVEKPLYEVGGRPMLDRVLEALAAADDVDGIAAAVSPHAPRTREHLADGAVAFDGAESVPDVELVETPGDGYVEDLDAALETVGRPTLTVAADLPLLAPEHVEDAVAGSDDGARSLTVRVPAALKRLLGATCDTELHGVAPTGLNVVGPSDAAGGTLRTYDARLAVNVNTVGDARIAEVLL